VQSNRTRRKIPIKKKKVETRERQNKNVVPKNVNHALSGSCRNSSIKEILKMVWLLSRTLYGASRGEMVRGWERGGMSFRQLNFERHIGSVDDVRRLLRSV
jgi:aconitase A